MKELVIDVQHLYKLYKIYDKPTDRLKEALNPAKKTYHNEYYALKDINFQIFKGDTVGIIGKNGSGKSTLLKILTGVLTPHSGVVNINGKVTALLELGAGFNKEYTGLENIYQNARIMGYTNVEIEQKLEEILNFADIGDFINQPVKVYSSGMFVRLAFAISISVDPDILIVDEALAVGDTRFQLKCMDKFKEFMDKGKTILFVTHDINSVKRFCTKTIWINEGLLMEMGETNTVTDNYNDYMARTELKKSIKNKNENEIHKIDENIKIDKQKFELIDIAKIDKVYINGKDENISNIKFGKDVVIEVNYLVKDIDIKNAVIGIAIKNADDKYICGLNTLLDKHKIKWEYGFNKCTLVYKNFNLVGGSYSITVAIFDETATVPIDFQDKYKEFFVEMPYVGEGTVILNHEWS